MSERLEEQLDLLISLLRIAHREPLAAERDALLGESVSAAILAGTETTIEAGRLANDVAKKTKTSTRTVRRRVAELLERGVLLQDGSGSQVTYRNSGLIEL